MLQYCFLSHQHDLHDVETQTFLFRSLFAGAPYNRRRFQLTCMVECDPVCSISWLHNNAPIRVATEEEEEKDENGEEGKSRFHVRASVWPPDVSANRLLSVESTLDVDLLSFASSSSFSAWPRDEIADAVAENSGDNYTCAAGGNSVGGGVSSTTTFRVHYPPRNITVGPR